MCLKYEYHSRVNSQHNWGDLYAHSMNTKNFTLITKKDIQVSSGKYEESGYGLDLDLLTISY
jgi:hypothetical protein